MKFIRLLNLILCVAIVQLLSAQAPADGQLIPANLVEASMLQGANFEQLSLFSSQKAPVAQRRQLSTVLEEGVVLKPDFSAFKATLKAAPENIEITVPVTSNNSYTLQLVRVDVTVPGLKVRTSSLGEFDLGNGQHYRGIIKGQKSSLVAISVFEDELMGFFSPEGVTGNYVIGKLKQNTIGEHIVYNEVDLKTSKAFGCFTESDGKGYSAKDLLPAPPTKALSDCVRVYVEVNFNTYQQNGSSVSATTNYINGLFNQSITLYANENINMVVSDIFIWTSTSPYSGGSSTMRTQFQNQTSSINGDIGHLISYISSGAGGIAAGFSGICNSNIDQSLCVTQTSTSYNTVPTYSRSVKVVTHEMGHLLGSRHTHACVWNGNNTAIDGCALATEGSCSVPSIPPGFEGTIMSYCDSRGTAPINFNLGFGPQPGNVIRNSVSNGSCLSPCGSGPVSCSSTISSYPYTNDFESSLGWSNDGGDDFDWSRNSGGTPSSGTGPSAAAQGTWYAYMEVSSPNYPSKTAILSSPCFDLTSITSPEITFQYHMLASPGTLLLEASTDGAAWTTLWSQSGDQGSSWNTATVSLNSYTTSNSLRLRFNGTSGTTWQGDICIDDIQVDGNGGPVGCQDNEVTVTILTDNYGAETTWEVRNAAGSLVGSGGPYSNNTTYTQDLCLPDGCYDFTIFDSYGDGICCAYGSGSYTVTSGGNTLASGGSFTSSENTNFCFGGTPSCPAVDFSSATINSYGGSQDNGSFQVQNGGTDLFIQNNAWKYINFPYTVTPNTVVEFEFRSTLQGEIHGIAFDNDNGISSNLTFKVHGTQNWGITNYDNYSGTGWIAYTIPVGSFYTGTFDRLCFVADHDAGPANGNAYFRNVKVYEGSCGGSDVSFIMDDIAIGNEEEGSIADLQIAPNPVSDILRVTFGLAESRDIDLKIMDIAGRTLQQRNLSSQAGSVQEKVDVSQLPAGMYFIQVGDETRRFAVVK